MMRPKTRTVVAAGALAAASLGILAPAAIAASSDGTTVTGAVSDRVTKIKDALKGLVSDGTLTQAQADKVATTLADKLPPPGGPGGRGGPGGHGHGFGPGLEAAASALGLTEDQLRTELRSGKSLADVAKAKGVSVDTLISKLVAAAKAKIAERVKAGELTQAQADERLADLKERITDMVNRTPPARPDGPPPGGAPDAQGSASVTPSSTSAA